jgi:hypothetical protein
MVELNQLGGSVSACAGNRWGSLVLAVLAAAVLLRQLSRHPSQLHQPLADPLAALQLWMS